MNQMRATNGYQPFSESKIIILYTYVLHANLNRMPVLMSLFYAVQEFITIYKTKHDQHLKVRTRKQS